MEREPPAVRQMEWQRNHHPSTLHPPASPSVSRLKPNFDVPLHVERFERFEQLAGGHRALTLEPAIQVSDGKRDSLLQGRQAIQARLARMRLGGFGTRRFIGDGIWELKIDTGSGYRVYYAMDGLAVVLLLCGGDKGSQNADIGRARACWAEYKREKNYADG